MHHTVTAVIELHVIELPFTHTRPERKLRCSRSHTKKRKFFMGKILPCMCTLQHQQQLLVLLQDV